MKNLTGVTRVIFLCFFASHIPVTLFLDSQALLGSFHIHPQELKDFLQEYAIQMKDSLMKRPFDKVWFQSLIACELLFQVPFFWWAVLHFSNISKRSYHYPERFRIACLIYGSHTATTLVPILATILTNPEANAVERVTLAAVYLPYLIIPLWLVVLAAKGGDATAKGGDATAKGGDANKEHEKTS
jgi:hypothetical protein